MNNDQLSILDELPETFTLAELGEMRVSTEVKDGRYTSAWLCDERGIAHADVHLSGSSFDFIEIDVPPEWDIRTKADIATFLVFHAYRAARDDSEAQ